MEKLLGWKKRAGYSRQFKNGSERTIGYENRFPPAAGWVIQQQGSRSSRIFSQARLSAGHACAQLRYDRECDLHRFAHRLARSGGLYGGAEAMPRFRA